VTTVLIVSDIRLYREGIALLLRAHGKLAPVAEVTDVSQALADFRERKPDVVLLDGAMPDAVGAVRTLIAAEPDMCVVVLGVDEDEAVVVAYAEAGISGYVTRDADSAALSTALETVAAGGMLCSPHMAATLLKRIGKLSGREVPQTLGARLTAREKEIVELVGNGLSNKEIAQRLCIEVPTVKNHVHNILEKLHVRRRGEVAAALRL
jgi:two-component system, NarL family, nitrate/nitrite response regulator NarL